MSFKFCCNKPNMVSYSILHDNTFSQTEKELLLKCIWYLPELQSYQANHDTIFSNPLYDDFLMDLLKNFLGLKDEDVKVVTGGNPAVILSTDAEYYKDDICINCGKLIYHQRSSKTKIEEFFNHLRNSIAHGCFNIVKNTYIGFDHPKYNGRYYTAAIKMPIEKLNSLNLFLESSQLSDIFKIILKESGFKVTDNMDNSSIYATKGRKSFFFVIKKFTGRYINKFDVREFIEEYSFHDKTNCKYVMIVDSSYSTSEISMYLKNYNMTIIDKKVMKYLLSGKNILEYIDFDM